MVNTFRGEKGRRQYWINRMRLAPLAAERPAGGRYEFRSHSGDVLIQLANDIGFELAAETFGSEIGSAFPVTPSGGRVSKREVHGVHDGSVMIEASTFSGDVTVAKE